MIHALQKSQRKPSASSGGMNLANAKQRVATLTLRQSDNRIPGHRRNMIVGDVSKGYFASTTGAVSEQTIAKYINSQGTRD